VSILGADGDSLGTNMQRPTTGIDMPATRGLALGRRGLLVGAAALAGLFGRGVSAGPLKAPRRQELTVGFANAHTVLRPVAQLTTFEIVIELESPAEAIRIGIANVAPEPYTLQGIAVAEASAEQPWIARPGSEWRYLGFGGGGTAPSLRAPQPVTVPGNRVAATGATNVPAILWSDWLAYRTTAGARPRMLFRVLVPPQQLALSLVGWPERTQEALPSFPPRLRMGRELPGDFVTDPRPRPPPGIKAQFVPLLAVQYRSAAPGIQIVVDGDSHPSQWHTFAQLAAMELSAPARPIAVWNVSWGSGSSRIFWPIMEMAIDLAPPSISVIEGWTANDGPKPEAWEHYLQEVQQSVEHTRRVGGIPIVLAGMPRKMFGTPVLPQWQQYNRDLARRLPDALIFDPDPVVEDPDQPGDWRAQFTGDRIHPNAAANAAMALAFERILGPLL
jgi:hypothetical protein